MNKILFKLKNIVKKYGEKANLKIFKSVSLFSGHKCPRFLVIITNHNKE